MVPARLKRKGFGKLGEATGLLLGLTTGLMHQKQMAGEARFLADEQFFTQVEGWEILFRLLKKVWPIWAEAKLFTNWPSNDQPGWHLGDTPEEVDSRRCYGVQLVDFLAYTTKRMWLDPLDVAHRVAIADLDCIVPSSRYRGVFLGIPPSPKRRQMLDKYWLRRKIMKRT